MAYAISGVTGTSWDRLTPSGSRSTCAIHSGKVSHSGAIVTFMGSSGMASLRDSDSRARSKSLLNTGANPKPQFPMVTDVTPCQPPIEQYGSQ